MHYRDKEHLENNEIVLVVYKHVTPKKGKFNYDVTSLQSCKNFSPNTLRQILKNPNKFFKKHFNKFMYEEFYETTIIETDDTIKIVSTENVSKSNNEFNRLH